MTDITQGETTLTGELLPTAATDGDPDLRLPKAITSVRQALASTPWLNTVAAATCDALAEQAVLHRVPAGSILFDQAEVPSFAEVLLTGSVDLVAVSDHNEILVEAVQPIDLLLPAAVLNRQSYLARAQVRDEAQLILIHADAFRAAVANDHAFCLAVLACQAAQFRRQVRQARGLRLRSAEERVACYLLRILENAQPDTPLRLPLEKRHIAWQLGMTRETLSRSLASLSRQGIRIDGDTISINNSADFRSRWHLDPLIDAQEPILPLPPGRR